MWLCVPWPLGLEGSLSLCRPLLLSLATAGWTRGPFMAFCVLAQKPRPLENLSWRMETEPLGDRGWCHTEGPHGVRSDLSIKIGSGGAGCGQMEKGSQQRQEREEDGWMGVTRERDTNSCPHLWDPRGGLVATCPLLESTCRGLCSCPQRS